MRCGIFYFMSKEYVMIIDMSQTNLFVPTWMFYRIE